MGFDGVTGANASRNDVISVRDRAMANTTDRSVSLATAAATMAGGGVPYSPRVPWSGDQRPDAFRPDVEIELDARPDEIAVLPGRPTTVWRYAGRVVQGPADALAPIAGSDVGPILRLKTGQKVRIRFRNGLTQPSNVHWHGLLVPECMDGHPRDAKAHP